MFHARESIILPNENRTLLARPGASRFWGSWGRLLCSLRAIAGTTCRDTVLCCSASATRDGVDVFQHFVLTFTIGASEVEAFKCLYPFTQSECSRYACSLRPIEMDLHQLDLATIEQIALAADLQGRMRSGKRPLFANATIHGCAIGGSKRRFHCLQCIFYII